MARVLILREAAEAERTARDLVAHGHQPLILPLERTVEIDSPLEPMADGRGFAGFAATSVRAIPALAKMFPGDGRALLAVGETTGDAARDAGFSNVYVAEGAAATMGALAGTAGLGAGDTLLYAAGRRRTGTLERALAKVDIGCRIWEVYDIVPVALAAGIVRSVLVAGPPDAVLLLSAGQAEGYARLVETVPEAFAPAPRLLALSTRIAEALPEPMRATVQISDLPRLGSLFECL
ncbi:uroporphyrinogen-III synthase [Jiella sp. MQZ9-1]|uniref:Uroporphyrinogen-III synthase n=1 Tax=Jiella flava TaxID=2816857 RepID=A0A939JX35_9HYPH|nr:uroporphyrinogen-III synthase [Jiella flava]MBO0663652.1 uroporphyrinogen-III synthase [Jiella flava]MCD2472227.1 uroporphyrinogen-III synthase [Jiella flava]